MAKVNIFISSTCYDLSQIRDDLKHCIIEIGHNPILSEQKDFPINPNLSSTENCINAVNSEADIFVLIIGNKYGSILESGKSITNTEFLAAINKGIPVYTFALKQMVTLLPMWKNNPNADFTYTVDNNKVFEFLADVREKRGLWNFEFEKAQDIIDILKVQLSNLFHEALITKRFIDSTSESDLVSRISSKALNILLTKGEQFEIKFFMQTMLDEINKHRDLKNDYNYSILVKSNSYISDLKQFIDWISLKFSQLNNFIETQKRLIDAFNYFYAPPGVKSNLEGLYYVARSYAKSYKDLLEWGIEVRNTIVPKEYSSLLNALAQLPRKAIKQIEDYPIESLKIIEENIERDKTGKLENRTISLCLTLSVDDKDMQHFDNEFKVLKELLFNLCQKPTA